MYETESINNYNNTAIVGIFIAIWLICIKQHARDQIHFYFAENPKRANHEVSRRLIWLWFYWISQEVAACSKLVWDGFDATILLIGSLTFATEESDLSLTWDLRLMTLQYSDNLCSIGSSFHALGRVKCLKGVLTGHFESRKWNVSCLVMWKS